MRAVVGVTVLALLGLGAAWTGQHLPLPHEQNADAADRAQQVRLERQYARFVRRVKVNARRARHAAAARTGWARSANMICGTLVRDVRAQARSLTSTAGADQRLRALGVARQTAGTAIAELEALPVPQAIAPRVRTLLSLYRTELGLIDRLEAAYRAGDVAEVVGVLKRERALGLRDQTIAAGLGANLCAYGFVDVG